MMRCIDCVKYALWGRNIKGYAIGTDDCLHHRKIVRWDNKACEDAIEQGWLEEAKVQKSPWPVVEGTGDLLVKRGDVCIPEWASGYLDDEAEAGRLL